MKQHPQLHKEDNSCTRQLLNGIKFFLIPILGLVPCSFSLLVVILPSGPTEVKFFFMTAFFLDQLFSANAANRASCSILWYGGSNRGLFKVEEYFVLHLGLHFSCISVGKLVRIGLFVSNSLDNTALY